MIEGIISILWALISFFVAMLVLSHVDKISKLEHEVYELKRWVSRDEKDLMHYGEILDELRKVMKDEDKETGKEN